MTAQAPTIRLTNGMREAITRRAVTAAFDPKEKAFAEAEDVLARAAYATIYTEVERKQALAIPEHWLRRDPCLNYNVGGFRIKLTTLDDHLPVPYRSTNGSYGHYCHNEHGTILAGELHDKIRAHAVALEALRSDRKATSTRLAAMLNSVSTLKKLREVWPEGLEFYSQYETETVALPPAIRMDEINAALGLCAA